MSNHFTQQLRVLALAPSSRGFGFAVLEGREELVNWGVKSVQGDKNRQSLAKIEALIAHYQPEVLVLEAMTGEDARRSARIRALSRQIATLARRLKVRLEVLPRKQVRQVFFADDLGTKHALAERLAGRYPEELGSRLPPKRKPWKSEDSRMDIFDAVALVVAHRLRTSKRTAFRVPGGSTDDNPGEPTTA